MKINATQFGQITVNQVTYDHDIIINQNEVLGKRSKKRSQRINGHRELAKVELEDLLATDPEIIVLGMGQYGRLPVRDSTKSFLDTTLKQRGIQLILGKTPDIIDQANEALNSDKSIAGILHVTC